MEISSAKWFSELEMEDNLINQYQLNPVVNDHYSLDDLDFQSFSSESYSSYTAANIAPATAQTLASATEQIKMSHSWNKASASSQIISFEAAKPKEEPRPSTRSPAHAQDHVLAERKRREKLSQSFIALSAVVPGLKKMDKASVLGDAIKHIKNLQQRVKALEEQTATKTMESVVFVTRSKLFPGEEISSSSSDENFDDDDNNHSLPEIEAKASGKDVLIRIHCENQKGCFTSLLGEIDNLHLSVVNTNVLPFGGSTIHITIVAQMDMEFNMKVTDLVRKLRQALLIKKSR